MVSDLVSPPIWFHRLRHPADRARGSVAHADAPLAYEHATAFAFREHISSLSARKWALANSVRQQPRALGSSHADRILIAHNALAVEQSLLKRIGHASSDATYASI